MEILRSRDAKARSNQGQTIKRGSEKVKVDQINPLGSNVRFIVNR